MRTLLLFLAVLLPWPVLGQGILWQAVVWDSLPNHQPFFPRACNGKILAAIPHPNGGFLGLGSSFFRACRPSTNSDTYQGVVSIRVSSSGDSLGLRFLNGFIGYSVPVFLRNNPDPSSIWGLIPRDTVVSYGPTYNRDPLMVRFDTSGSIADSFTLAINNPYFGVVDAAFVSPKKLLISGSAQTPNFLSTFEAAMIAWPEGVVLWRRSYTPNQSFNGPGKIMQLGPNRLYLVGRAGTHLVAQKIDTLGNAVGGMTLWTDSLGGGIGGEVLPLPNNRFAIRVVYGGAIPSNPNRPYTVAIGVVDTAGRMYWKRKVDTPQNRGDVNGYRLLVGANDDGSLLVLNQPNSTDAIIERYSANGDWEAGWSTVAGDTVGYGASQAVYLGNNRAYIVGSGGVLNPDPFNQRARYWAAYLDGVGNGFDPTATQGPRIRPEPLAVTVYPNPTTDRLYIDSDKPLAYRILSATGALVQQGIVSRSQPAELSGLSPGMYQLLLAEGRQTVRRRFVKQ